MRMFENNTERKVLYSFLSVKTFVKVCLRNMKNNQLPLFSAVACEKRYAHSRKIHTGTIVLVIV